MALYLVFLQIEKTLETFNGFVYSESSGLCKEEKKGGTRFLERLTKFEATGLVMGGN